ncbi:hypothetical protein, partial [Arsukibacterium sp.]|uniref:hypothetical protein n=1 Tax=Arsukibacterium sp. TaxID=1977258 RepID=UPI002FD889D1
PARTVLHCPGNHQENDMKRCKGCTDCYDICQDTWEPLRPTPQEEFWYNMAQTAFWVACTVAIILCMWVARPEIISQVIDYLTEVMK